MNQEFLERIETKKNKLEDIKVQLKEKFIGIDDVIDKIVDNISLWYLTPEIQFRPLIISLWGITGVGKTDLVRTLVKLLDFTDKFIEIQMDTKNDYLKTVETYLENSGVDCKEPSILLLDEIQRFRTIDENGSMLDNSYFNDVWMLLSDGKFQNNSRRRAEAMELLMDELYYQDMRQDEPVPIEEEKNKTKKNKEEVPQPRKRKFNTSHWTASRFKKLLNLDTPLEEIMQMTIDDRMRVMDKALSSNTLNEGKSYEKLLIFISGNLDEAFRMAEDVEDTEKDADIYHELSKRINIIHIKNALASKFKPEQIARFGNNHIIYPCLTKDNFYTIIKKNAYLMLDRIEKDHNIKITLSDAIFDIIYRNGVFPTQGVRPVISTVFNILGSNLPYFIYYALLNNTNQFHLDFNKDKLFININGEIISKDIILEIDSIRKDKSIDEKMLIIVHELGHALVYSVLFNTPPKQINVNSSGFAKGFVINHTSINNKTYLKNEIAIYLAGLAAEEMVFGEDFKSTGSTFDIANATDNAAKYIRNCGMDGNVSYIERAAINSPYSLNYDIDKTNEIIESMLVEQKLRARDILNRNVGTFKQLIKFSIDNGGIGIEDFLTICNKNKLNIGFKELNEKLIYSYDDKLKHFLE